MGSCVPVCTVLIMSHLELGQRNWLPQRVESEAREFFFAKFIINLVIKLEGRNAATAEKQVLGGTGETGGSLAKSKSVWIFSMGCVCLGRGGGGRWDCVTVIFRHQERQRNVPHLKQPCGG